MPAIALVASAQVVELSENFTTATQTTGGWTLNSGMWPAQNNSDNPQPYSANGGAWGPGGTLFNPAPGGGYFATDTTATGNANGTVSDWLLTPVLTINNGDTLTFQTRTRSPEEGPSRLEIRLSTAGSSTNVGTASSDVGSFTQLVGTINPNVTANAYPTSWTTETFTISGLTSPATGRIAFQTYYPNGGFAGPNGDTVGLASVTYTEAPASTVFAWTGSTSGNWNTSTNWSTGTVPTSNVNNQITFSATANATMNNNIAGTLTLNSMTFNAGSPVYSLTGNGLNFASNSSSALPQIVSNSSNSVAINVPLSLTNNLTVGGSGNIALGGVISGAASITMSGSGVLTLSNGSNANTGGININSGTVQVPSDSALSSGPINLTAAGTLSYSGTTTTARNFTLNGGTLAVTAGKTLTLNGSQVSNGYLDGAGTFATSATNGAQFAGLTATPSVAIISNSAKDQFSHFDNSSAFSLAAGVNTAGNLSTTNLNGFTNEGAGSVTVGAGSQLNVANFQSYGNTSLVPATTSGQFTELANVGTSALGFNGGSQTFVGSASAPNANVVGVDLHGQNMTITGGLFVNNGLVFDSTNSGNSTIYVGYGATYKGAGTTNVPVITQNGGKVVFGNSPGQATYGSLTIGSGGIGSFGWQINDAGPSATYPTAPGVAGPTGQTVMGNPNQVSGWSEGLVPIQTIHGSTSSGAFTWNATSTSQFDFQMETLLGPYSTVGTNNDGAMSDFDPNQNYRWEFVNFQGPYSGPTSDATLTADTLFDKSSFVNTIPSGATFTWDLVLNTPGGATGGGHLDLLYSPNAVPEPGTLGLVAVGLFGIWRVRRRRGR